MWFKLEINTDNDAFRESESQEIIACLKRAIKKVEQGRTSFCLLDSNGNTAGHAYLSKSKREG
jgi:hypothetical protein